MKRYTPLRRSWMKPWRRKPADKVTPAFRNYIGARDRICVLATLDPEHVCRNQFGDRISPSGQWELHHIDVTGFGKRGPNVKWNGVRLCPFAHRLVTENAKRYRPMLRRYAERVEGVAA